jgi:hypothetical protein
MTPATPRPQAAINAQPNVAATYRRAWTGWIGLLAWTLGMTPAAAQITYQRPELVSHLKHDEIVESSGLANSYRHPGLFWTHNDSGDEPRIFAFDEQGNHHGTCRLKGALAVDWEDMGSFTLRGQPYLFVADVGDNTKKREQCTIYLIAEPDVGQPEAVARPLTFRYEDGPMDCEGVALDTTQQVFILVEKVYLPTSPCRVYELAWKPQSSDGLRVARPIGRLQRGRLSVPMVTGLDISADGRRAAIVTYGSVGLAYERTPAESWQAAFAKSPREIALPGVGEGRRQGEAICYGGDGVTLYLTSEKRPCPLFVIRPAVDPSGP